MRVTQRLLGFCKVCGNPAGKRAVADVCWSCYRAMARGQTVAQRRQTLERHLQREHTRMVDERAKAAILHERSHAWGESVRGLAPYPIFWYRCVVCQTTTSAHSGWGECINCRAVRYRDTHPAYRAEIKRRNKLRYRNPLIAGRWARAWDECQLCHKTDKPHAARGYCMRCYSFMRPYLENVKPMPPRRKKTDQTT